jgi:hypothetical protein
MSGGSLEIPRITRSSRRALDVSSQVHPLLTSPARR